MASRRLNQWMRRLWVPVAAAGAAGVGAAFGLLGRTGEVSSDLDPGNHQSAWIFGSSDCDWSSRGDPVNVVFVGARGLVADVVEHAGRDDHGGFDVGIPFVAEGKTKYFIDHLGECEPMDDQKVNAYNPRYHMRYNQGDINGVADWDSAVGGYYTLAPAHYERYVTCWSDDTIPIPNPFSHAVYPNEDPFPGGFDAARDDIMIWWTMIASDSHGTIDFVDWGNREPREQCNGDVVRSDGYVAYISMPAPPPSGGIGHCGRGPSTNC